MKSDFNSNILMLIGLLEQRADDAFGLAKNARKGSNAQKRLLKAFELARKAADEVRLAGADI